MHAVDAYRIVAALVPETHWMNIIERLSNGELGTMGQAAAEIIKKDITTPEVKRLLADLKSKAGE